MWDFEVIGNEIKEKLKYKANEYGSIYAVKCITADDFELMKRYYSDAYTSCYDPTPQKIKGDFKGKDWYFIEKCDVDYGMGAHETKYWFESLTQKKEKFKTFCAEYEKEDID